MNTRFVILLVVGTVGMGAIILLTVAQNSRATQTERPPPISHGPVVTGEVIPADSLLEQVQAALDQHVSIDSQIRQTVHLFGFRLVGNGRYLERRWPEKQQYDLDRASFRLEMKMQSDSSLIRVCDRRYLWQYRNLLGSQQLSRIDIPTVARRIEETGRPHHAANMAEWFGLGGLGGVIRGVNQAWEFDPPQPTLLDGQLPVYKVQGHWRAEYLQRVFPDQKETIAAGGPVDWSELSEPVPDTLNLYISREELFPHRFEYLRRHERETTSGDEVPRTILVIDFFEVKLDTPIAEAQFRYSPGDLQAVDDTRGFLVRQGLEAPEP